MPTGLWFIVVGGAAAAVHMAVFALLHHVLMPSLWPEFSNFLAFFVAFFVSFAGHRWLTFKDANTSAAQSLGRFAVTALVGFASNELVFVFLHRMMGWWPLLALLCALVFAAGQTWFLSRYWAFSRRAGKI